MREELGLEEKEGYPWLKNYPAHIDWNLEIPCAPLWELFDSTAQKIPQNPCVDFLGKKYTYADISHWINHVAKGLQERGVKKGDKIGIFMPNTAYYVIFYFGILKAGGTVVNFNPLYTDKEVTHQIKDSQLKMIVTLDMAFLFDKVYKQLSIEGTSLEKIILCPLTASLPWYKSLIFKLFKSNEQAKVPPSSQIIDFSSLTNNDGNVREILLDPEKDIAVLQYTGGTTGVPKGAMLTHRNVYANAIQAAAWLENLQYGEEKTLVALPLFHVYAMTAALTLGIYVGAELYMMFPRFDVKKTIQAIKKYKITLFPGVPTMYNLINQELRKKPADLSSLKCSLSGGAGLPLQIKKDFEKLAGGYLVEAYGLSETSPGVTTNPLSGPVKEGSIGMPFPRTIVKIFSIEDTAPGKQVESPREMPLGEKGHIAIKGPQVMAGYWQKPEETKAVFVGDYLLTGDVGYMDEEGYIFLVDRLKDLIICSGFNVYPRIVEEAIYKHPAVSEVTVIGVPDEKRGETVKAYVKLKEGMALSAEELLSFLKDRLSPIEMPKFIEFREELPKTIIGKLSKKELKAEMKKSSSSQTP